MGSRCCRKSFVPVLAAILLVLVHLTVKGYDWWAEQFARHGWERTDAAGTPGLLLKRLRALADVAKEVGDAQQPELALSSSDYQQFYNYVYDHVGYHADAELSHEPPYVNRLAKFAVSLTPPRIHSVVVLGCSHGKGAWLLHKHNLLASGIDIAEKAVNMANKLRGRTCGDGVKPCFVQGSLLNLPYHDQSFDAGMSVDVLEHIAPADVEQVVREFTRVVRYYLLLHPAPEKEYSQTGEKLGVGNVHLTVKGYDWWAEQLSQHGWERTDAAGTPGLLLKRLRS